jgi:hypothetical protein
MHLSGVGRPEHNAERSSHCFTSPAAFKILTYLLTYLLTPWCRILFENLIVTQLSKNILLSYGT